MIYMYNEAAKPWELESTRETFSRFRRTREVKVTTDSGEKRLVKRNINILFPDSGGQIDREDLIQKLQDTHETRGIVTLVDKPTTIIFNRKEFAPFIGVREDNYKDLLFVTIILKGRRVVGSKAESSYILESMYAGGEISFIASLNGAEGKITITLFDDIRNVQEVYQFSRTETGIDMTIVTEPAAEGAMKPESHTVRKYRPSRPTHIVLVRESDRKKKAVIRLSEVTESPHEIIYYKDQEELKKIISDLRCKHYQAVTFFSNIQMDNETNTSVIRDTKDLEHLLAKSFSTIFRLHSNGFIRKIKY